MVRLVDVELETVQRTRPPRVPVNSVPKVLNSQGLSPIEKQSGGLPALAGHPISATLVWAYSSAIIAETLPI